MPAEKTIPEAFERLNLLVGERGMASLLESRVLVVGVGGVGSYAAEALARAAIGYLELVDFDRIRPSNVNRQLHALAHTVGKPKVEVMAERLKQIHADCTVVAHGCRLSAENVTAFLHEHIDFVVDAIDEATAKTALLAACVERGIPVVSSMGAANKLLPSEVRVADISRTRQCPLARTIRKQLRRMGMCRDILVVYSEEDPIRLAGADGAFQADRAEEEGAKRPQGTVSYMPALFGLHCAAVVIQHRLRDVPLQRRGRTPQAQRPGNIERKPADPDR